MKVYQCDRCKKIFEPVVLPRGAKYITRKGERDVDLCDTCFHDLDKWFDAFGAISNKTESPD